jgi:endonuclease/exonuclease/phosphatase (EEP) superfamily protein YafD
MTITSAPPGARPGRRVARTVLLWLLVLPGLAWAILRLFGWESGPAVQLFAFTPYAAVWTLIPAILALALRKWLAAAVAVVAVAFMAVCVLPRAVADHDRGITTGKRITVMTINMYIGAADPSAIVKLVKEHDVDVLAVQEFTPPAKQALSDAGLGSILPYSALADQWGPFGTGLYTRFPIATSGSERGAGNNEQVTATVDPPGGQPIEIRSTHPQAPYATSVNGLWREDLDAEPHAGADGPLRIILGDFNSTLDHAPVRALIAHGYRDAADAVGKGLIGTWGWPYDSHPVPAVTLDHVLVDRRMGVRSVEVRSVVGSDHRSVIATLIDPAAS